MNFPRIHTLLIMLLLAAVTLQAQYTQILGTDYPANSLPQLNSKPSVRTGTSAPTSNCTAGLDFFLNTATTKWYVCTATNVWTENVDTGQNYANPSWLSSLAWGKLTGVPSTFTPSAHTHVANDTTSGVFNVSLIPDLDAAKITTGSLALARIAQGGATTNQVLAWNGTAWAPAAAASGGLTQVNGSGGISCAAPSGGTQACSADLTVVADRRLSQAGTDTACIESSGSTTAKNCTPTTVAGPNSATGLTISQYWDGMRLLFRSTTASSGTPTLTVSSVGAKSLFAADGASAPAISAGVDYTISYDRALVTSSVNTSGVNVTWVSGATFAADLAGQIIRINAVDYVVASRTSSTALVLATSAGTQTGVTASQGAWKLVGGASGSSVTVDAPYLRISSQSYLLPFLSLVTTPPSTGWSNITATATEQPTLTTASSGALILTPNASGTDGNYQYKARTVGTNRSLTVAMTANLANNAACLLGVYRNGSGSPYTFFVFDNFSSTNIVRSEFKLLSNSTLAFAGSDGPQSPFEKSAILYYRIRLTGGNVLWERSFDGGLNWSLQRSDLISDRLGTSTVLSSDSWFIGATRTSAYASSSCTILSWQES